MGSNKKFADGNGIGLFLTQKIILLHEGTIEVKSKEGDGTTFTIKLEHTLLNLVCDTEFLLDNYICDYIK